jgi:ADP-ribose pyrophosphatase YjhB (NUDIX family)
VLEEAGLVVEPQRLLAVYDRSVHGHRPVFPFHVYKLFIHCAWDGSEPVAGDETMAARFFPVDGLPPLSTGRVMEHQLVRMAELAANPALPPDLD